MYYNDYEDRAERHMEKLDQYTVLTPRDIMDILGIGKNAAYNLLNSGQLRGFRVGRSWRVSAETLEEFRSGKRIQNKRSAKRH